jgi:hypothetical protein
MPSTRNTARFALPDPAARAGRARLVTQVIRREMRRRAAVEPVIGHLKDDEGDRINAVLAAAGYSFSLLLRWFRRLLCALFRILALRLGNRLRLKITQVCGMRIFVTGEPA